MSKTTENVIVVIAMIAIVAGLLLFVGFYDIRDWLSKPFIWKQFPDVEIQLYRKEETSQEDMTLYFMIKNKTQKEIKDYAFLTYIEGTEVEVASHYSYDTVDPFGVASAEVTISTDPSFTEIRVEEETFDKIRNTALENLQIQYKTVYLEDENGVLVKNNGTGKIVTILIVSLVLGLLGMVKRFPVWMRIILKICSLPVAVLAVALLLFAGGGNGAGAEQRANDSRYNNAKQRYNRAAALKAGGVKTGNVEVTAKAQAEMDRAMADMLTSNGKGNDAAARYKREANLKAGATMTGRRGDAARAQANMDKALADMIKKE